MANVKLVISEGKVSRKGECEIYIKITAHNSRVMHPTGKKVRPEHWINSLVVGGKKGDEKAQEKNLYINRVLNDCQQKIADNPEIVKQMDVKSLERFLFTEELSHDFFAYCKSRQNHYDSLGKTKMAKLFGSMSNKVRDFHPGHLDLRKINVDFLELFEGFCRTSPGKKGPMKVNGIATYLRYLRIVLNDAIDDKLIIDYPFRKFEIKTEKTKNRNLAVEVVRKIRDYQPQTRREKFARDITMIQLYLFGLNIIDLFYLRPFNIVDNRLQFKRTKTDKDLSILLEPEAKRLLEAYKGEKYLLWFADNCSDERKPGRKPRTREKIDQWANNESFNRMINHNLQKIHDNLKLNLPIPLTSYASRHTFATLMHEIGIVKDTISMCLSHSDPEQNLKTTGIYIKLDYDKCDKANRSLIDFINEDQKDVIEYSI